MAKKKVKAVVKIQIPAGQATPAPPVGTALGPHGVAIMDLPRAVPTGGAGEAAPAGIWILTIARTFFFAMFLFLF